MTKAFVVVGPESSGTKVITQLFCLAGCFGDYGHSQRIDSFLGRHKFPEGFPKDGGIVFRRSIPHGGRLPDIADIKVFFELEGFNVFWVVLFRDWYCNIRSAPKYGHKLNVDEARMRLPQEWAYIGAHLHMMKNLYILSTSQMFLNPDRALTGLSEWAELDLRKHASIVVDADAKYF